MDAAHLPPVDELRGYEALVILTGFARVMLQYADRQFTHDSDGFYHVPWLTGAATDHILAAGLALVAIDSNSVERQTSSQPHRMSGDAHLALLGNDPPVLIMECLNGAELSGAAGPAPAEGLFHMVPRRVNAAGADAAHARAFLYFYREDGDGTALRALQAAMTPQEYYG